MIEIIADKVKTQVFDTLEYVTRSGGLTIAVQTTDEGNARLFPGYMRSELDPCDAGSIENMGPNDGDACILFVVSTGDLSANKQRGKYTDVDGSFQAVCWIDTRRISSQGIERQGVAIAAELMQKITRLKFSENGLNVFKIQYSNIKTDTSALWASLGVAQDNILPPYQSFAIEFTYKARVVLSCFSPDIIERIPC